jgi:hypothetical protein
VNFSSPFKTALSGGTLVPFRFLKIPANLAGFGTAFASPPVPLGGLCYEKATAPPNGRSFLQWGTAAGSFGIATRVATLSDIVAASPAFPTVSTTALPLTMAGTTLGESTPSLSWLRANYTPVGYGCAEEASFSIDMSEPPAYSGKTATILLGVVSLQDIPPYIAGQAPSAIDEVDVTAISYARLRCAYSQRGQSASFPDWRVAWTLFLQGRVGSTWCTLGGACFFPGGTRNYAPADATRSIWTVEAHHGGDLIRGAWADCSFATALRVVGWYGGAAGVTLAAALGEVNYAIDVTGRS